MKVTIASDVKSKPFEKGDGTERYQDAYLHEAGKPFPTSCKVRLYDNARPYAQGEYETKQDVEVNSFGVLRVKTELALVPLPSKG